MAETITNNLKYEQINWGWLNDYSGYKFAPFTFYEKLYTSDGKSFKNMYDQTLDDLKTGKFIVGNAQRLVEVNDDGFPAPYNMTSTTPIYFNKGMPTACRDPIVIGLVGHVNKDAADYTQYTLKGGNITSTLNNTTTTINGGTITSQTIFADTVKSPMTGTAGTTINGGTIDATMVNSNITFPTDNYIIANFTGDVTGTLTIKGSNTTPSCKLTLPTIKDLTANSYGSSSGNNSLKAGNSFIIPYIAVNTKGQVTAISNKTFTLDSNLGKITISPLTASATTNVGTSYQFLVTNGAGNKDTLYCYSGIYADWDSTSGSAVLMGAAWNDYAEYRNQQEEIEAGYCVYSNDDGLVSKTTKKLQSCDGIVSDTFGFAIGKTDVYKTPLAVAGRVLAYCEGDRNNYHAGDVVCAGPEGKVYKMTREEIEKYPDRIVGIVSEIPQYEKWNNKKINNRIWIKVK